MTTLIGEAAEQDEAFWGADVWESDDDSFSEVEVEPDVFDSDFNDTEDEDGGSSDEEKEVNKAGKKERTGSNKYKEPGGPKVKRPAEAGTGADAAAASAEGAASSSGGRDSKPKPIARKKMLRVDSQDSGISGVREVRQSTKVKTEVADRNRKRVLDDAFRTRVKARPPLKHQFTQKELLLDALSTETDNQKWLEVQRLHDYERALGDKVAKPQNAERFIRFVSRRGAPNTVTFSHVDLMPVMLRGVEGDGGEDEDEVGGDDW